MTRPALSRRLVLRGAGVALGLPLLEAMLPRAAGAAPASASVLIFNTPNGCYRPAMTSSGSSRDYALAESLRPLEAAGLREDVTVLSGLDNVPAVPGGDVHSPHVQLLTCGPFSGPSVVPFAAAGPSWDQAVGHRLAEGDIPLPSLVVSAKHKEVSDSDSTFRGQPSLVQHYLSWTDAHQYVRALRDPLRIYEALFGIQSDGAAVAAVTLARRKSLIDAALPQVSALRSQVGERDRVTLDAYLSGLREVERRLAVPASSCGGQLALGEVDSLPDRLQLLLDLCVLAFQCERSRLIVLTTDYETTSSPYPWVSVPPDWRIEGEPVTLQRRTALRQILDSTPYHLGLSHHGGDPDKIAAVRLIDEWHVERFASLVSRLKAAPHGSGSLLDSALAVLTPSIADGSNHSPYDLPCVVAGRGGGRVKPGRHLRLATGSTAFYEPSAPADYHGVPFANLLLTLSEALGSPEPSGVFGNSTGQVDLT